MNLRLFAVRNLTTGKLVPGFFADKNAAKRERDKLGKNTHAVTPGPDHRRYRAH